jgi:hypothetical protein
LGAIVKTSHGVRLYTEARGSNGKEISTPKSSAAGLVHHLAASWRFANRPGDFIVKAEIEPATRASYKGYGSSRDFAKSGVTSGIAYEENFPIDLTGTNGQVTAKSQEILVFDDWLQVYVKETKSASQVLLTVVP